MSLPRGSANKLAHVNHVLCLLHQDSRTPPQTAPLDDRIQDVRTSLTWSSKVVRGRDTLHSSGNALSCLLPCKKLKLVIPRNVTRKRENTSHLTEAGQRGCASLKRSKGCLALEKMTGLFLNKATRIIETQGPSQGSSWSHRSNFPDHSSKKQMKCPNRPWAQRCAPAQPSHRSVHQQHPKVFTCASSSTPLL